MNGAGKSTISNYLYSPKESRYSSCSVNTDGEQLILVYNQAFIQDNFYVADQLKGIFSLSKENSNAERQIKEKNRLYAELQDKKEIQKTALQNIEEHFANNKSSVQDEVWKIKTTYTGGDRVLEYCLDGLKGQKGKLFEHLLSISACDKKDSRSISDIKAEVDLLSNSATEEMEFVPLVSEPEISDSDKEFLAQPIIGNSNSQVANAIDRIGNADWVRKGLCYLSPSDTDSTTQCPFCQSSTVSESLRNSLREYFDDSYQRSLDRLSMIVENYSLQAQQILPLSSLTQHDITKNEIGVLSELHRIITEKIQTNVNLISQKQDNPAITITLLNLHDEVEDINNIFKNINCGLEEYNERLRNREKSLLGLKDDFWDSMYWEYFNTIERYEKSVEKKNVDSKKHYADIQSTEKEISSLAQEIAQLQKTTVNTDEAVESINKGLIDIGIDEFRIEKHKDNLYKIVRINAVEDAFRSLSEGEKMIISFLYFIELCKGKASSDETDRKKVVVIDDPVSSLSHIFIFNVGQLIRSNFFKSDNCHQVFVLTHSLYFYYELTDPNHQRRKENQSLFRINKTPHGSEINVMRYEEIQNDYQSYWAVINDPNQPPALIANCMRNIVEYFFNFVRKKDLNNVFQSKELKEAKYQAFCRYINRESHSLGQNIVDMKEFDYNNFRTGLSLVFSATGYEEHFNAMANIEG